MASRWGGAVGLGPPRLPRAAAVPERSGWLCACTILHNPAVAATLTAHPALRVRASRFPQLARVARSAWGHQRSPRTLGRRLRGAASAAREARAELLSPCSPNSACSRCTSTPFPRSASSQLGRARRAHLPRASPRPACPCSRPVPCERVARSALGPPCYPLALGGAFCFSALGLGPGNFFPVRCPLYFSLIFVLRPSFSFPHSPQIGFVCPRRPPALGCATGALFVAQVLRWEAPRVSPRVYVRAMLIAVCPTLLGSCYLRKPGGACPLAYGRAAPRTFSNCARNFVFFLFAGEREPKRSVGSFGEGNALAGFSRKFLFRSQHPAVLPSRLAAGQSGSGARS